MPSSVQAFPNPLTHATSFLPLPADAPQGLGHADRQAALRGWNFRCRCSLCRASASAIAASDARRARLHGIHAELTSRVTDAAHDPATQQGLRRVDDVVDELRYLIDAEAVTGQMIAVDGGQHLAWETPEIREIVE